MRAAAKRDATEPEIVKALELAGWTVVKVSDTGLPDLVAMRRGVVRFLEVKSPGGKLTPAQQETFQRFAAALVTVHVVRTPEEALMAVGAPVEDFLRPLPPRRTEVVGDGGAYSDKVKEALSGHRVTPDFQREQTESVVPKRRMWPQHPDADYIGDTPKASIPGKRVRERKK